MNSSIEDNELALNHVVDIRLSSYESFFDHQWAKSFGELTDKSRLPETGFCLTRDWKGAALVGRMPWLIINSLKHFHGGFTRANPPFAERVSSAFAERVVKDVGLSNMSKKKILANVKEISAQIAEAMRHAEPLDQDATWGEYLQIPEFQLSLWNSQRMCYGAIYYAYENFAQRCIAVGRSDETYRAPSPRGLAQDFARLFGDQLRDDCLMHPDVEIARLARNDLAHNGGRASQKLLERSPSLTVEGGDIHIMPNDVRSLFDLLKVRATTIAERATHVSAFLRT